MEKLQELTKYKIFESLPTHFVEDNLDELVEKLELLRAKRWCIHYDMAHSALLSGYAPAGLTSIENVTIEEATRFFAKMCAEVIDDLPNDEYRTDCINSILAELYDQGFCAEKMTLKELKQDDIENQLYDNIQLKSNHIEFDIHDNHGVLSRDQQKTKQWLLEYLDEIMNTVDRR